ncbi:MAG TPA: patatin-like phospholipase family protein [Candidatus Acidoferrales bacterium]|nr:patatin-like phospholipase family protein [Candidatus Acidoferrales bacterium]
MLSVRKKNSEYVLALGGGGARGLAHIGVLKVLQAEGINIGGIAGISMGAIIGAMYAYYGNAVEVEEIFKKFLQSQFHQKFSKTFFLLSENPDTVQRPSRIVNKLGRGFIYLKAASKKALFSQNILKDTLDYLLPDIQFSAMRIPFISIASDLVSGRQVVFRSGKIRPAVIASSLIPGIVETLRLGNYVLTDGSVTGIVPVKAARDTFSGKVIAVDVSMTMRRDFELRTAFDVALRANEITSHLLDQTCLDIADHVISPKVGNTNWANFDKLDEMIHAGEVAARRSLSWFKNSK